jgi:hypothetical protein
MTHEFSLADARQIPITRKVDTSNVRLSEWEDYLPIGGDFKADFDLRDSDERIRQSIDASMQQLAERVRDGVS